MGRGSFSFTIRVIAGAYIAYLGYQIISGYINPTEETGEPRWYILLFGIVFVGLGIFFVVDAVRKQVQTRSASEEEEEDDASAEEGAKALEENKALEGNDASQETSDEDEYVPPQTMSIAERIRRLSAENDEEEEE